MVYLAIPLWFQVKSAPGWRAMRPPRAPLLLLGAVLGASLQGSCCGSSRHSLCYSCLKVSEPIQGLPQFLSLVHLDDQPITRFDLLNRKMVPLVPWMETEETQILVGPERWFWADLVWLSKLNNQTGGLHTWQVILGCELREDGSKGGFFHYGYDGRDFIRFNKETLRWVAAQPQAQVVKEKWDDSEWSQENKYFLEKTCIERLQRYLRKEALKKTDPPVGKVTHKVVNDSLEVLICQVFGFYPKEIQATWTRDGEVCKYRTLRRNVAPNSDVTYYVWLSIEIDPKERDRFRCHMEYEGLQEPLILAFKEETAVTWKILVGMGAATVLGAGILFLNYLWNSCRKTLYQEVTTCHRPEINLSPSMNGTEYEMQSQSSPQPKVTLEHKVSSVLQRTPNKSEITA